MSDTVNFAFRLPPELKAAAQALNKANMALPFLTKSRYVHRIDAGSINEALVSLATLGLEVAAEHVQWSLDRQTENQKQLTELMCFFMNNLTANEPLPPTSLQGRPLGS